MGADLSVEVEGVDYGRAKVEREREVALSAEAAPLDGAEGVLDVRRGDVGVDAELFALQQELAALPRRDRDTLARGCGEGQNDEGVEHLFEGDGFAEVQDEDGVLREVDRGALDVAEAPYERVDQGRLVLRCEVLRGGEESVWSLDDGGHGPDCAQTGEYRVYLALGHVGVIGEGEDRCKAVLVEVGAGNSPDRLPGGDDLC